ncbi:MAG TPA: DUF3107 domain-containing protein [Pseudonocardia sp.]|nr:DUF3107 domain-containing protein [Pseudonocardia sp.]
MEVKIGIAESPRELVVSSGQTPDEVEAMVNDALKDGTGTLALVDDKGRRFLVPASRVSYVEIAPAAAGRVGFMIGDSG